MEIHTKVALTELTPSDGAKPAIIDVKGFVREATREIDQFEAELDGLVEQRHPTITNNQAPQL